jgi:hypothetical protein
MPARLRLAERTIRHKRALVSLIIAANGDVPDVRLRSLDRPLLAPEGADPPRWHCSAVAGARVQIAD